MNYSINYSTSYKDKNRNNTMANTISNLSLALMQTRRVQIQQKDLNLLAQQLGSGKKTDSFKGLGLDAIKSKRARADLNSIDTYIQNIEDTDQRIQSMLNVIDEFKSQIEDLDAALLSFSSESAHQKGQIVTYDDGTTTQIEDTEVGMNSAELDDEFQNLRNLSKQLYTYMYDLMNTQDHEGNYLLGGAESQTKPLSTNSFLDASISKHITDWKNGTLSTAAFAADLKTRTTSGGNTDAFTDTVIGYNAALSAGNAGTLLTRINDRQSLDYTALANEAPFRDILVGLSLLQNDSLPPIADVYTEDDTPYPASPSVQGAPGLTLDNMKDNFFTLFDEVTEMVTNAIDDIDQVTFRLEGVRARMNSVKERYQEERGLLLNTIADVEDVDMNDVAIKINMLSIQIEASYSITASIQQLSLVNFI
jgi:flagellar hook-associated protein 3 FlgL